MDEDEKGSNGVEAQPVAEATGPGGGPEQEIPVEEDVSDEEVNNRLSQEEVGATRQTFTSENFKIALENLPNFCGIGQMKKFINGKLKLNAHKLKPCGPKRDFMFVCFK
jgi:hypothetical protein